MTPAEREHRDQQITEFRYQLVAELANPYLSAAERRALIRHKAKVFHDVPFKGRRRYTVGCIHKWLALFRKHGRDGLAPRPRRDAGQSRSLSESEAAVLLNHLEQHPELTATAALRKLQQEGRISANPSSSALSRLVRSAGLHERARQRPAHSEQTLKFDFFAPLECVQVDYMYGPRLPGPKGRQLLTLLLAFLDDATRRIIYATWGFSETAVAFETGIHHVLAAHGRIGRLYCDHGSPFVSTQTRRILDALGLFIAHSRVRRPAGRGKVERFFRTVRQQFLAPLQDVQLTAIADLDQRFHLWLESEYHRSPHRGLDGATPLDAWIAKSHLIVPVDPAIDLDAAFRHEVQRKVHRDSTVTLDGVLFEVPSTLVGARVLLRYDPTAPPPRRRLFVHHGGRFVAEATLVNSYVNAYVRRADLRLDPADHADPADPAAKAPPSEPPTAPLPPAAASLAAARVALPADFDHSQEESR